MSKQLVVALCGPAGAGKSTVAEYLEKKYGASRYSFAAPLKEMVKRALDFSNEQVYGTQEQKEAVDPRYGKSARWFLQRIGTEGCRAVFGDSFWTKQCIEAVVRQNQPLGVIEDCRFANEAVAILDEPRFTGFVWRLHPVADAEAVARMQAAGAHASEGEWASLDANLEIRPKARGIEELYELIDTAMQWMPLPESGLRW